MYRVPRKTQVPAEDSSKNVEEIPLEGGFCGIILMFIPSPYFHSSSVFTVHNILIILY